LLLVLAALLTSACPRVPEHTETPKFTFTVVGELRPFSATEPEKLFVELVPFFQSRDVVLADLAGVLASDCQPRPGALSPFWDAAGTAFISQANLKALSLADDHALDCGWPSLNATLESLQAQGFYVVGAGQDPGAAAAPLYLSRQGVTIAVVSFLMAPPEAVSSCDDCPGPALYQRHRLNDALQEMKGRVQHRLLVLHLTERERPGFSEEELARVREAVDFGADLVIGYGPSGAGGLYRVRGRWAIASMGRLSGEPGPEASKICDGFILSAEFTQDRILNLRLSATSLQAGQARLLRGGEGEKVLRQLLLSSSPEVQDNATLIGDILYLKPAEVFPSFRRGNFRP
jgi:poly-gamma-glutamate synthesis protein (capsule biosynthesis protein)